jgi:hypothetical protein
MYHSKGSDIESIELQIDRIFRDCCLRDIFIWRERNFEVRPFWTVPAFSGSLRAVGETPGGWLGGFRYRCCRHRGLPVCVVLEQIEATLTKAKKSVRYSITALDAIESITQQCRPVFKEIEDIQWPQKNSEPTFLQRGLDAEEGKFNSCERLWNPLSLRYRVC